MTPPARSPTIRATRWGSRGIRELMGDRDEHDRRADGSASRGHVRSEYLFWTSPRIRSFTPVRPGTPSAASTRGDTAEPAFPERPTAQDGPPVDEASPS